MLEGRFIVVELLEYTLVFAVSVMLAGFSVLVLQNSLPSLHQTQSGAEFQEISGAAGSAAVDGTSTITIPLSNASISCSQGVMSFHDGGLSYSSTLGYPCNFDYGGVSCLCKLVFTQDSQVLELQVES
jgi:hypothetical protein